MAQERIAPDGSRALRDGETVIDCGKALAMLQASPISSKEERAAHELNISRGVLRRIIGRDGDQPWSIVLTENASAFALRCGGQLGDIEWHGQITGAGNAAPAALSSYLGLWRDVHAIGHGPYVPLTMRLEEAETEIEDVATRIGTEPNLQVIGPSGCGKSHLLAQLSLMLSHRRFVPVMIRAGHFTGNLDTLLEATVASATTLRFSQLMKACVAGGLTPIVLVDALNECPPTLRTDLLKSLQELRIHFGVTIVTSDQTDSRLPASFAGLRLTLDLPDAAQKRRLVEAYLGRTLPEDAAFALDIVTSAHDAVIWAEVFDNAEPASSRYALYESFARRRLGTHPDAALAYRTLSKLAVDMRGQFVSSLPAAMVATIIARAAERLAHEGLVDRTIRDSGILQTVAGRTGFRHELLQDFFAAAHVLIDARALPAELARPVNAELTEFAIGGLSGARDIEQALSRIGSGNLLVACLSGRCGALARRTVEDHCRAAITRLGDRICAGVCDYAPEAREGGFGLPLAIDASGCPALQSGDLLYLTAAATVAVESPLLDDLLALFGRIDAWIESERQRLRARYPDAKIAWRMCIFTGIYCLPIGHDLPDVQRILQSGRLGSLWRDNKRSYDRVATLLAGYRGLSPGQLYFLIEELHAPYGENALAPSLLYDLAERAWNLGIYHLRLSTTHMLVMHARDFPDDDRKRFIELAQSWFSDNGMLNGSVIDVLKALNALDDEFTPEQATAELNQVIDLPLSQEACERAFTLYGQMFDHPYDSAYGEAFYSLEPDRRIKLLTRAAFTESTDSMFFSYLVSELAKNPVAETIPVLQRVALAPNQDTISIQESVSTFVGAVTALAHLQAPLPEEPEDDDAVRSAWRCARNILYHLHRPGVDRDEYMRATRDHWQRLHELRGIDVPMRIVRERWRNNDETSSRLLEWSRPQLLRLCRDRLANGFEPLSSFVKLHRYGELRHEHVEFAIQIIGAYGDRSDLAALTVLLENTAHGASAIKAARSIESR